jgi:hypothetical protein
MGSQYFEPYTGIASSTTMTMHIIVVLEGDNHTLQNENSRLHSEYEQLKWKVKDLQ